jgi:hypothetical protein
LHETKSAEAVPFLDLVSCNNDFAEVSKKLLGEVLLRSNLVIVLWLEQPSSSRWSLRVKRWRASGFGSFAPKL